MIRLLVSTVLLTLVYALALASFNPWDLALGALLSLTILFLLSRPERAERASSATAELRRLAAFFPFASAVLRDMAVGTGQVIAFVLAPRPAARPGIVTVPIGERTRLGVAVAGMVICIAPGSTLLDVDWQQGLMVLHVLDARDPDAVRAQLLDFYERYQRHVFP